MSRRNKKKQQRDIEIMKQFMENADQYAKSVSVAMENIKHKTKHEPRCRSYCRS